MSLLDFFVFVDDGFDVVLLRCYRRRCQNLLVEILDVSICSANVYSPHDDCRLDHLGLRPSPSSIFDFSFYEHLDLFSFVREDRGSF